MLSINLTDNPTVLVNITKTLITHNIVSDMLQLNYIIDDFNVSVVDNFNSFVVE